MTVSALRLSVVSPLFVAGAAVLGVMAAQRPLLAVAVVGLLVLGVLPLLFPVAHLIVLVVVLAVVPYGVQNQLALGGATGSIGLVVSDLLLAGGLFRALVVLMRQRLPVLHALAVFLTLVFLMVVLGQLVHGAQRGALLNEAGGEARALVGYGTVLIALPLMNDPLRRRALLQGLLVVGLLIGLWGLVQWMASIEYGEGGNFGVRQGVELTSAGRGQLLGGLFSFPVAVVIAVAVLLSGAVRGRYVQAALVAVVALNGICLLLTYERTFWLVALMGCIFVAARAGRGGRWRALVVTPVAAALVLLPVATLSPDALTTGRERLLSLGQYGDDPSVYYRLLETRHVADQIKRRPLAGSGLGASIYWGRPLYRVPPDRYTYVHNGYVYLAWKLGVIVSILLVVILVAAALRTRRRIGSPMLSAVVNGAQGALLALLISNLTFPSLVALSATGMIGLLLAICLVAPTEPARASKLS